MPRSARRFGFRYALTALAAVAVSPWASQAHAQTEQLRPGEVDPSAETQPEPPPEIRRATPLEGFRREIDPDRPRDPFASDRAEEFRREEAERARRGESLGGNIGDPQFGATDRGSRRDRDEDRNNSLRRGDRGRDGDRDANGARADGEERQEDDRDGEEALRDDPAVEEVADPADAVAGDTGDDDPYEPLGLRMGSFLVFPEVTIETLHTDNALESSAQERSDQAVFVSPSIRFLSNWSRHLLDVTLSGTRSYYSEFDQINDEAFTVNGLTRLDVTRRTNVELTALYDLDQEDVDSDDAPTGAAERGGIKTTSGSAQLSHTFNRLTASLRGSVTHLDYDDVRLVNGGIANNDDRDFTETEGTARLSYEFRPGVAGFVEGSYNERDFDSLIDDNGIQRGSDGYRALGGVTLDFGGDLTGEVAAGYALQDPDETRFQNITGMIFEAGLQWQVTPLSTISFEASSEIDESTAVNSPGSLINSAEISVEHAFRRNLIGGVSLGYSREEFTGTDNVDEDYSFGLTGEYLLNRSVALTARYDHSRSTNNPPDPDTIENEVRMGVRLRK